MMHTLDGFKLDGWENITDQYGEALQLKIGTLVFEIRPNSPTASDRGRFMVYFKNLIEKNESIDTMPLHRETKAPMPSYTFSQPGMRYPDTKPFFNLDCAIADIQNYLYQAGFDVSVISRHFYKPNMQVGSDERNKERQELNNDDYGLYVANGKYDSGLGVIKLATYLKTVDKEWSDDIGKFVVQLEEIGLDEPFKTCWHFNIMQCEESLEDGAVDYMDLFPRRYSALRIAREEAESWLEAWRTE